MEVTFDVKYKLGHSYQETWEDGNMHCPGCGVKGVWEEQSDGDYYCGPSFMCPSCGAEFTMQYGGPNENWQNKQRLSAILARIKESVEQNTTNEGQNG
jgi:transposase-like protein